jgi:outer membrane protein TolC
MKRAFCRRSRAPALIFLAFSALPAPGEAQSLTLLEAVDAALATHPSIVAATARIDAAQGAGDAARAGRLPGAAFDATLNRFQKPMVVAPFHSLDLSKPPTFDRTLIQGQLAFAYTIFDGGERSARINGADAIYEATRFGRSSTEMSVIDETATAYVGVLSAQAFFDAATAQVEALEEEANRAQRRFDAGTAAELEVLRANATLQEARAQLASAEARTALSVRVLARLMGVDAATISPADMSDVSATSTRRLEEDSLSPVVLQADRSASAAAARVSQERAGRLPTIQAGAGLLDYGTLDGMYNPEWQAGLQVSWPLFTGGARSASVRRAEAELAAARSDVDAARLHVAQAVDAAETAVVEADARAGALEVAVVQWEEVARIEALALEAGSGIQSDLLRSQAGLFQARAGHIRARYDAVLSRIGLARAEGTLDRSWMDEALEASR